MKDLQITHLVRRLFNMQEATSSLLSNMVASFAKCQSKN
jgi:hypothetical protein